MIIACDFDGTLVSSDREYTDVETPLEFLHGAKEGLQSLKAADHVIVIYSARANRALRIDPNLDPLVRAGLRRLDHEWWESNKDLNEARYQQMVEFCKTALDGIVDVVDDGQQGKPCAGLFIDDRAMRFRFGDWLRISRMYGEKHG